MYTVEKVFCFEYAHRLHLMEGNHPCKSIHGHSGKAVITITSDKLTQPGMVIDFKELKFVKNWLNNNWDHTCICAVTDSKLQFLLEQMETKVYVMPPEYDQVTSENLAHLLHTKIVGIIKSTSLRHSSLTVAIRETENNIAKYSGLIC